MLIYYSGIVGKGLTMTEDNKDTPEEKRREYQTIH
jgi:hypothetical protein